MIQGKARKDLILAAVLLALFLLFTVVVSTVNVASVPVKVVAADGSWTAGEEIRIGLSGVNVPVSDQLGYRAGAYKVSKYLGYLSILTAVAFVAWFICEAVKRRSAAKADRRLIALMILFALTAAAYLLFEVLKLNYRPVVLDEGLEASYPSTHTLLAVAVMGGAARTLTALRKGPSRLCACALCLIGAVIVICRCLAGVHWLTDILGGLLLGAALLALHAGLLAMRPADAPAKRKAR